MIVFGIYKVAVFIWVDSKKWYVVFSFFSLEYSNLIFQVWDKNSAYGDVTVHSAKITDNNPGYYEDWTSPHIVLYIDRTLNSFDFFLTTYALNIWFRLLWKFRKKNTASIKCLVMNIERIMNKLVTWGFSDFHPPKLMHRQGNPKIF